MSAPDGGKSSTLVTLAAASCVAAAVALYVTRTRQPAAATGSATEKSSPSSGHVPASTPHTAAEAAEPSPRGRIEGSGSQPSPLDKGVSAGVCSAPIEVAVLPVPNLRTLLPGSDAKHPNMRLRFDPSEEPLPYFSCLKEDKQPFIIADIVRNKDSAPTARGLVRAGPRDTLYFNPKAVTAAIVTCGGLCPGLNNVVREITETLVESYGATRVYGIKGGYWGFHTPDADLSSPRNPNAPTAEPLLLTPDTVADIHHYGGTYLGSDRGGHDVDVILRFCANRGVNQLFVIGGDGTHRGANAIATAAIERGMCLSVVGTPKTIDNDVAMIDKSFGFDTAYSEAVKAIHAAKIEAMGAPNGIGIVKLMGRYAGFIAAFATIASGDVDLCLIPEVPVVMDGPASIHAHLEAVLKRKGHAVVVVAEGAGEDMLDREILAAGGKIETDAGGNKKLPPIGPYIQKRITSYFADKGVKVNIKYIDPSYMIRSVPANPADSVYCTLLAQNAVHAAMAGYTGVSIGMVNARLVLLPISEITRLSPRRLNARGRTMERLLQMTQQPDPFAFPEYYGSILPDTKAGGE